jgi:hypothetical protein
VIEGVVSPFRSHTPITTCFPASAFGGGTMRYTLERQGGRYIRIEVYDTSGVLLGAGNPLWLLLPNQDVEIPHARRLVLTHH